MATEANPNTANDIGIKDDLGEDILKETVKHLENEVKMFTASLEDIEKTKARYEEQWNVDKRFWELQCDGNNLRKIDPTYGY